MCEVELRWHYIKPNGRQIKKKKMKRNWDHITSYKMKVCSDHVWSEIKMGLYVETKWKEMMMHELKLRRKLHDINTVKSNENAWTEMKMGLHEIKWKYDIMHEL